jgi:pheromone shutdown protein TraB
MLELIFIGTLHCGFTNKKELRRIIYELNPDLLLVEITEQDTQRNNLSDYPEEMIFALNFAKQKNISCKGFDSEIDVLKKGIKNEDEQKVIKSQERIIHKYSWKDFNKSNLSKELSALADKIIDLDKWNKREEEMKLNIERLIPLKGTVLILTGSGHIPFFKTNFKDAKFPLSD